MPLLPWLEIEPGRAERTSSAEEDLVAQPALHLVSNYREEQASLIPTAKYP